MKFENRQLSVPSTKDKSKVSIIGKKCKNTRKKSILHNTDKDALLSNHGLGCKPGDPVHPKLNSSMEIANLKKIRSKKISSPKPNDKMPPKSEKMQERLEQCLSSDAREKISSILNDVKTLSDVEKLFLYLQLPTGTSLQVDAFKSKTQNPLGKKADEEGLIAVNWIQSHFEEDANVSLPKQEVYNEYQAYCQMAGTDSLCAADFGKVMKQIFPSVKPRRLGTRGNSRYCYSGLQKKLQLKSPSLPDMHAEVENSETQEKTRMDETTSAACHVVFQWAEKLLGLKFASLKNLASHLLENMYVDNRSVAAVTVLLEGPPELLEKGFASCEGSAKKSGAQIHLHRKIQEKELIKEQKKKLQEQRSSLSISNKNKGTSKKKVIKSKKTKLLSSMDLAELSTDKESNSLPTKSNEGSFEATFLKENDTFEIKEEEFDAESVSLISNKSTVESDTLPQQLSSEKKISPHPSPGISLEIEDNVKKKSTLLISPRKTPVCIQQNIPGIIILSQLSETGKQSNTSKYKRIQPKPLKGENSFSAGMRVRAGSVGSSTAIKPKSKFNDGRRSSHAWLQSAFSPENSEDITSKGLNNNIKIVSLKSPSIKGNARKNSIVIPKDKAVEKSNFTMENNNHKSTSNGAEMISSLTHSDLSNKMISELILKSGLTGNYMESCLPSEDNRAVKRHLNENGDSVQSKRAHLDVGQNLNMSESLFPCIKNAYQTNSLTSLSIQEPSIQSKGVNEEEVSVHDIEGDALNDYFRGVGASVSSFPTLHPMKEKDESESRQLTCNKNKVKQLSQLRMLLEQNLPKRITSISSLSSSKEDLAPIVSSVVTQNTQISSQSSDPAIGEKNQLPSEIHATHLNTQQFDLNNLCSSELMPSTIDKLNSNNSQFSVIDKLNTSNSQFNVINKLNTSNSQFNVINKLHASNSQFNAFDKPLIDLCSNENNNIGGTTEISDPNVFLISSKNNLEKIDVNLNNSISDSKQDIDTNNFTSLMEYVNRQVYTSNSGRVNTYTQVPSVPQSPNTRRRAFNFMPISPRHTPVPENLNSTPSISSPVPNQCPRNMMSIAVGPSQPPSNAGSPFISPRSTPVSMCRSRHSSGQSTYSTSRHTPFQSFDSGVSSVSSSPFISPQPTPVPVSRLRHNSSHNTNKTVTFCSVNPQIIHSQSMNNMGQLRSRHSSGPGGPHLVGNLCTSRSAPLSPLVSEQCPPSSFTFPSGNEVRSRHNSGSNTTTPLSPVSEHASSSSSCTSNLPDLSSVAETASILSHSFINDGAADLFINGNQSNFKQVRQRHASSSVIYSKQPYLAMKDTYSSEIQNLLKNSENNGEGTTHSLFNRSQSVPLHQMMLQNLDNYYLSPSLEDSIPKSHPTTPILNQVFSFPLLNSSQDNSSTVLADDLLSRDKALGSSMSMDWASLESAGEVEMSSARRNLANLLDPPLSDDLQTTLEDLRDCDTDFSKFAQELELNQNDDGDLQFEVK
ncbi:DNA-binding protein RFX5 [Caerostris darwini]|uniref:DNA-binding protein RFX5 n=1 Tax=Caerostris darwini TaxID=1538125 RepID=A0AAV4V625_9ARAC|nr:DNA-binding protein RFX5 [Caerostris darwini]